MKAKVGLICFFAGLLLMTPRAGAQQPPPPPSPPQDPIGDALFAPDLVMRHQQALSLEAAQKNYIREEIRKSQLRFTDLQWQLQDAVETMHALLQATPVSESQVLAQLDKVLELERDIKHTQIALMIRIKNKLTPEQQALLRRLRAPMPPNPPAP